jgi:hypothetical protein
MSVIRSIGSRFYNLTKIIKVEKGKSFSNSKPFIEFTTNTTNNFAYALFSGFDEDNRIYFNSIEERDDEYDEIKNILKEYYKK